MKHVVAFLICSLPLAAQAQNPVLPLEQTEIGQIPEGWKIAGDGDAASVWEVVRDGDSKALAMVSQSDAGLFGMFGGDFNVITNQTVTYKNAKISVRFKAISGNTDQGGGIMWRVQDDQNYYVARFNPLEDNFRFYTVTNGHRRELASAIVKLSAGWHTMTIEQNGTLFRGSLDGNVLISHRNESFPDAGGIGLWTKSDAVTWFRDFAIENPN